MVLRLQTAEGEIKEYEVVRGVGSGIGGEVSGPDKWISKCGLEFKEMPGCQQECDHLACAIAAVEDWSLYGWMAAFFAAVAAIIPLWFYATAASSFRIILIGSLLSFGFIAFVLLAFAFEHRKRFVELKEFKSTGSIRGIKCWKVSNDLNIGKSKHPEDS